ncbi:MAG: hypothetical protein HRT36_03275 [Alphaproteobacteria bacterium]|nr:hypothetical protein [Alphaproteobacteria bacterium]
MPWFTRLDIVPVDAIPVGSFQDRATGEPGAVVRHDLRGLSINPHQRSQATRAPEMLVSGQ